MIVRSIHNASREETLILIFHNKSAENSGSSRTIRAVRETSQFHVIASRTITRRIREKILSAVFAAVSTRAYSQHRRGYSRSICVRRSPGLGRNSRKNSLVNTNTIAGRLTNRPCRFRPSVRAGLSSEATPPRRADPISSPIGDASSPRKLKPADRRAWNGPARNRRSLRAGVGVREERKDGESAAEEEEEGAGG